MPISLTHMSLISSLHITLLPPLTQPFLAVLKIQSPVIHLDSPFSLTLPPLSFRCPSSVPLISSSYTCFSSHYFPLPFLTEYFCTRLLKTAQILTKRLTVFFNEAPR